MESEDYEEGEYYVERENEEKVMRDEKSESEYMMIEDIEEEEKGDKGKVRKWMEKEVKDKRDKEWKEEGYVWEKW